MHYVIILKDKQYNMLFLCRFYTNNNILKKVTNIIKYTNKFNERIINTKWILKRNETGTIFYRLTAVRHVDDSCQTYDRHVSNIRPTAVKQQRTLSILKLHTNSFWTKQQASPKQIIWTCERCESEITRVFPLYTRKCIAFEILSSKAIQWI